MNVSAPPGIDIGMHIGKRRIGPDEPCFIVAEMSGNHGQDFERARAIVQAAAEAGADAVKMQAYTADTITLDHDGPDFRIDPQNSWARYRTLHQLYSQAFTPWEWLEPLTAEANRLGMEAFCSVFDRSAIDWLEARASVAYKIAAPEITDIPLLRAVAATHKPVILSSGVADYEDLALAVGTLRDAGCDQIVVLKCTSEYPAPVEQANLRTLADISASFDCFSGLSDHTTELAVPVAAVCVGARIVEKHFTLDDTQTVDSFFSLQPRQFREMVDAIRVAERALGRVDYSVAGQQSGTVNGRRSLYAAADIAPGDTFGEHNIRCVRPAYGLHPRHWDALLGRRSVRRLHKGDRLTEEDLGANHE